MRGSTPLAAAAAALLSASAAAQDAGTNEDASKYTHRTKIQQGLIAAGVLTKPIGHALKPELRRALRLYRDIFTGDQAAPDEIKTLASLPTAMISQLGFTQIRYDDGRKVVMPRKLLPKTDPSTGKTQSYDLSERNEAFIYTFRWRLQQNPPSELLRKILKEARQPRIIAMSHSNRAFAVHLQDQKRFDNGQTVQRTQFKRAFTANGYIVGVYVSYIDRPSESFALPDYLASYAAHWTPPADLTTIEDRDERLQALRDWLADRHLDSQQKVELEKLFGQDQGPPSTEAISDLVRLWSWRKTLAIVRLWVSMQFEDDNRWISIAIDDCWKWRPKKPDIFRDVRVIIASNRERTKASLSDNRDVTAWFNTSAEPGNALNIACTMISVPTNSRAQSRPKTQYTKGWLPGSSAAEPDDAKLFRVRHAKFLAKRSPTATAHNLRLFDTERRLFNDEGRALLFVHGYNTSFEHALLRVSQIAAATKYPGRVYLFSWPSDQKMSKYMSDMDSAERSEIHFSGFLRALLNDPAMRTLDVIAHSMGAQLMIRALSDLRDVFYARDDIRLGQIVLAAPDVAVEVFTEKMREIGYLADNITIYGSSKDKPLRASQLLRGKSPRLGQVIDGSKIGLPSNARVIDASSKSNICNGWGYAQIEHSYFGEQPALLKHIAHVLIRGLPGRSSNDGGDLVTKVGDKQFRLVIPDPDCWWKP